MYTILFINFTSTVARQMRTIQYSLASTRCMDEGWTVQPEVKEETTPNRDHEIFQVEVNSTLIQVILFVNL